MNNSQFSVYTWLAERLSLAHLIQAVVRLSPFYLGNKRFVIFPHFPPR